MNTCNAMRQLSLGQWRRAPLKAQRRLNKEYTRQFCLFSVARRVQDGLGVAIGLGETLTGKRLSSILPKELAPVFAAASQVGSTYTPSHGFRTSSPKAAPWHVSQPFPPTTDLKAPNPPPEQLRTVMRLLSQSVVVCTAIHDGAARAITMSSFTSLTLSPTPVITFNVATPSRTLDAIASTRYFNIHILSGDASGAAVADHFTRGNTEGDIFKGLDDATVADGDGSGVPGAEVPVIHGKGVMHVLRCKLLDDEPLRGLIRVRDHVIVAGEVVDMIAGTEAQEFSLAYADRKYRQVGSVISKE